MNGATMQSTILPIGPVLSMFRRGSDVPLFKIVKGPKLARRQGALAVLASGGRSLMRRQELGRVLGIFDSKLKL